MEPQRKSSRALERITYFYDLLNNNCSKYPEHKEKLKYLSKVISDCEKILELAKMMRDEELDCDEIRNNCLNEIDRDLLSIINDYSTLVANKVNEKNEYYIVTKLGPDKKNPQECIEIIEEIKNGVIEQVSNMKYEDRNANKIKVKSSLSDIVRIFEEMKRSGIISSKTSTQQIAELFFTDTAEKLRFEKNYNAVKNRIKRDYSSTNSTAIKEFLVNLSVNISGSKSTELEEIIYQLTRNLKRNII